MHSQKEGLKQKEEKRPSAFEKLRNWVLKGASSRPGQKVLICPKSILLAPSGLEHITRRLELQEWSNMCAARASTHLQRKGVIDN